MLIAVKILSECFEIYILYDGKYTAPSDKDHLYFELDLDTLPSIIYLFNLLIDQLQTLLSVKYNTKKISLKFHSCEMRLPHFSLLKGDNVFVLPTCRVRAAQAPNAVI